MSHYKGSSSQMMLSKSLNNLNLPPVTSIQPPEEPDTLSSTGINILNKAQMADLKVNQILQKANQLYNGGHYNEALTCCEMAYDADAFRTDNLLLLGAIHFQLRNFSESIFYNQQCIRVDPNFAEGYSNLGNALKELGDVQTCIQFYLKAIKLKPRYCDAYNNLACAYMQLGQANEAMETYQMSLVLNPSLVDAHSNLGNLYKAHGDLEAAKKCYLEAIRIKPDFPIAWSNLAGVFKEQGQLAAAIAYYKEAIRLCPEFADAHSNLGNALKDNHQLDDAMVCYKMAIKLRPDFAIAHGNLGSCFYEMGSIAEAIKSIKYALQLEPNYPDGCNNLGNALREDGRLDEAIQCFRSALSLKPDHPYAYNNLGNAMKDKHHVKEAIHCYVTAIRLLPTFAAAHCNLGSILKEQCKYSQALSHYHEAIQIDPVFADAYSNMGNVYKELGEYEDAIKCYITAIKIRPSYVEAYTNLAAACKDSGKVVEAIQYYQQALIINPRMPDAIANLAHAKLLICDWVTSEEDFATLSQITELQCMIQTSSHHTLTSIQPFHALFFPFSLSELQQISLNYSIKVKSGTLLQENSRKYVFRPKSNAARLKIGYVSSNFGNHSISYSMQSVFAMHDRGKYEVTCYALSASDQSLYRLKIESEVEYFKDISLLHPIDAAQLIYNDGINILVDLDGYTKGARTEIFAMRPCPLQISCLGYTATMASDCIDYIVADETVIPEYLRPYYSEKVIYMPHSFYLSDNSVSQRDVVTMTNMPSRATYGLSEDSFIFCNFNQLSKIDSKLFTVWMNVLKRVPNSVLWLVRYPENADVKLLAFARELGVRDDQIIFSDVTPRDEHIKRCYLADLFLDTSAYSAHSTATDCLWSGTPLLSLLQEKMASRVSSSILNSLGLNELVCHSHESYEELAVTLAQDSERLFGMRRHIESCRDNCAVFDPSRWVRSIESAYSNIWDRYDKGVGKDHIMVEDDQPAFVKQDIQVL